MIKCNIKANQGLFSILVLNYNNFDYLFNMLDSIYNQTYDDIEIIIADDGSSYFDKNKIIQYINKKERKFKTSIYVNNSNIGTVKTINKYLAKLSGDYFLITSSDDVFANNDVIENFVKYFSKTNSNIVTAQWIICNNDLKVINNYIPQNKIEKYNNNQKELLFDMCKSNRFGAGSTAYKKEIFNKYKFDESYKYLEDWPFWLKLLFNGEKIYFADFDCLLHRSGGISEITYITESKKIFIKELMETFHKEIIPNLDKFNYYKQYSILNSYKFYIEYYGKYIDISIYDNELKKIIYNNKKIKFFYYLKIYNPHLIGKILNIIKYNRIVLLSFVLTIVISFIMIKHICNNDIKLIFIILTYIMIYIGIIFLKEVRRKIKWKNTR